ncbi:MAG: divergent polysaccharide deacetylase family protein [Pseudomonadota bacterium]
MPDRSSVAGAAIDCNWKYQAKRRSQIRMGRAKKQKRRGWRKKDGHVGLIAGVMFAAVGMVVGALSSFLTDISAAHASSAQSLKIASLRDPALARAPALSVRGLRDPSLDDRYRRRMVQQPIRQRPKIVIIFDDLGIDKAAFRRVMDLPGPLTFSFLPYANGVAELARDARARGDEIMLHLPMEPMGAVDPGPNALLATMSDAAMLRSLLWNLDQIEGYGGVNNHMGSHLTTDHTAMRLVLTVLKSRNLFFLDSVTTGGSIVEDVGDAVGATVFRRDLFLDAVDSPKAIEAQLLRLEELALENGVAVAICHPRKNTIDVLGPWLTTAPARGFDLAPVSILQAAAANS